MAITQVKALFRGVEYDLTYNEETRNYEHILQHRC